MKITSSIKSAPKTQHFTDFPQAMQGVKEPDRIVLFFTPNKGVALADPRPQDVGVMFENWVEAGNTNEWKPFFGKIALEFSK